MLRHQKIAGTYSTRFATRDPGPDLALAATLVFFGVFPIMLVTGLMIMQMLGDFAR